MSKSISIRELQEGTDYELVKVLDFSDLLPFIMEERTHPSWLTRSFWGFLFLLIALAILDGFLTIEGLQFGWSALLEAFGVGIFFSLTLLILVHEALHGLAYKLIGAPHIYFGGNWRKLYFYALADRFVVGKQAFFFVALTPFVLITLASLVSIFTWADAYWRWVLWGGLLMHTPNCLGDIYLMNFFLRSGPGPVYTYDDADEKKAWFFRRAKPPAY